MLKRTIDILFSIIGLVVSSPILIPVTLLIWLQDLHSPFYIAPRVGKGKVNFNMIKLRSMIPAADKSGVDSTGSADTRITRVGHFVRKFKLDELMQLWNVLAGDMSLVGPRPQVPRDVALYTREEEKLLSFRPGITDFASIVFADEGDILKDQADPDLAYNQLIRPWKSRLGLFYIEKRTTSVDLKILWLTGLAIVARPAALKSVQETITELGAEDKLIEVAGRKNQLYPFPPPGSDSIVLTRS